MKPVCLFVVDDHALFRSGLISLLSGMDEFQVVGEAGNGREALPLIKEKKPDVVLLDVNMPEMGGVETVQTLKGSGETCRILMLTISKSDEDLLGAIIAGADGYLLKNASPEDLCRAILNVHGGHSVLAPDITRQVMRAVNVEQPHMANRGLSDREMEVLECLAEGKTTSQISSVLFISDNTVKTHVRHILEKLEASNRAEAVSKAMQIGLIRKEM
jgi:DNA-binding NarL/FixJ family response regulator